MLFGLLIWLCSREDGLLIERLWSFDVLISNGVDVNSNISSNKC